MKEDDIDRLIEEKMAKISEAEEPEEVEIEKEDIKVITPTEKKVVSDKNSAIVIEQKGDDPDAIVIKPFKKG